MRKLGLGIIAAIVMSFVLLSFVLLSTTTGREPFEDLDLDGRLDFNDLNGDGAIQLGENLEPFSDTNGNGAWDPGAGVSSWVVAVIIIVCVAGVGVALVARREGPSKIKAPARKAEAVKPAEPKPKPKPVPRRLDREVLGYIAEHGGKISIPAASKELEVSKSEVKEALERLKRAGKLEEE